MKTLELNHIQHYPIGENGVKLITAKHQIKYGERTILTLNGVCWDDNANDLNMEFIHDNDLIFSNCMKPMQVILHPLSDLTKPITVPGYNDGKEFVPIDILLPESDYIGIEYMRDEHIHDFINKNNRLDLCYPFSFWQKLYQWHFDLEGLIRSGLAIDINTL